MTEERYRRTSTHHDHAGRVRTRTPIVVVPARTKAKTIEPAIPERIEDEPENFDTLTPVESILAQIAQRGVLVTRELRSAVEEIHAHTRRVEKRSADRLLAAHEAAIRGAPPPTPLKRLIAVAKWLGPLLVAIAGAIYAAGIRQGVSESAAAERASDRAHIEQAIGTVRRLELDLSNLRGAMRAREDK